MTRTSDLLCFSHLRWGFVFQRPNHLMSRAARSRRTFFFEEPRFDAAPGTSSLEISEPLDGLTVCVPHVPAGLSGEALSAAQRALLDGLLRERRSRPDVLWYYTPMALAYTRHLRAPVVVFDCMDELSAFAGAPPELGAFEDELFARADLVFTGGHRLYRLKRNRHPNVHPFPSSVDALHFQNARIRGPEPEDQAAILRPRLGFFGVIDERIDLELIDRVAQARPLWHWVLLGPVAKIDPLRLPRRDNIHWLGQKDYASLPAYLSGWDVATMPFALNASTAFISPTKTLEYMAAGRRIVSTPIADVVEPYGRSGAVLISEREGFAAAVERALAEDPARALRAADEWVAKTSWDKTWRQMEELVALAAAGERSPRSCTTT